MSTAEPIAKPLPVAAVVLPSASSESVMHRTSSSMAGSISGEAAGVVRDGAVGVRRERDAERGEHADGRDGDAVLAQIAAHARMAQTRTTIVGTHEIMPTPRPWIVTVAGPVAPRP